MKQKIDLSNMTGEQFVQINKEAIDNFLIYHNYKIQNIKELEEYKFTFGDLKESFEFFLDEHLDNNYELEKNN